MPTAYYASKISPNQFETPTEGYRICRSVRICRTGYQDYLGSELKKHPSYDSAWELDDTATYKVFRPLSEVTSPATVSSFEGKTIADEHPDGIMHPGSLVHLDNERELSCGHMQNVRVGACLGTGETPLVADLHVKDGDLIDKIDSGVRDVSCGYTYALKRTTDGSLIQTNIRGNHIAVVQRGRAGTDISIQDSMALDAIPDYLAIKLEDVGQSAARPQLEELIEDDDTDVDDYVAGLTGINGGNSAVDRALSSNPFAGIPFRQGMARYQNSLAVDGSSPELPANHFYAGVPYHVGKKAHEEYLTKRRYRLRH